MAYSADPTFRDLDPGSHQEPSLLKDWFAYMRRVTRQHRQQVRLKRDVARQRAVLAHLSDHQLRDIGIARSDALAEARRSFDDLPIAQIRSRLR